jgi:hypothetical protein
VPFDVECDVGAVVYGSDDDPDRRLIDFVDDLRRSGLRPVGVVQLGRNCQSDNPQLSVVMLPRLVQASRGLCCRMRARDGHALFPPFGRNEDVWSQPPFSEPELCATFAISYEI